MWVMDNITPERHANPAEICSAPGVALTRPPQAAPIPRYSSKPPCRKMPSASNMEIRLAQAWPPTIWRDVRVLVAVSGGADSVALLRALAAIREPGEGGLAAAHFNHQLRGEESQADERFVVALCGQLAVPCEVGRAPVHAWNSRRGEGLEAAARTARYDFLLQTAARLGARYVVTAHTADDQAETILHRIARGTGLAGLAGMARTRPLAPGITLLRPLLEFRRSELLAYLDELGQSYRHDVSNEDVRFTRNRIRLELLPELARHVNPGVIEAIVRLGALAAEAQTVIDAAIAALDARAVRYESAETVYVNADFMADQARYTVRELLIAVWRRQDWPLQAMGFAEWDLLAQMLCVRPDDGAEIPRKRVFPGNVVAEFQNGALRLYRAGK